MSREGKSYASGRAWKNRECKNWARDYLCNFQTIAVQYSYIDYSKRIYRN